MSSKPSTKRLKTESMKIKKLCSNEPGGLTARKRSERNEEKMKNLFPLNRSHPLFFHFCLVFDRNSAKKKFLHFLFPANFHRFCKTIKINLVTQSSKEESNFWNRECFFFSAHQFDAIARSGIKGFGQTLSVSLSIFRKKRFCEKKLSVKNVRIFFSPPVMHFWTFERHFKQKCPDFSCFVLCYFVSDRNEG